MPEFSEGIGLTEVLEVLRAELVAAQEDAARKDIQFPIETLTVELKFGVTKSKDGRAGIVVPFLGAQIGGTAGVDRETVQTISVVFGSPVDHDGSPIKVTSALGEPKD